MRLTPHLISRAKRFLIGFALVLGKFFCCNRACHLNHGKSLPSAGIFSLRKNAVYSKIYKKIVVRKEPHKDEQWGIAAIDEVAFNGH